MSNNIMYQSHLIKQYDVVGFDQIAGSSYNADDDKNLYKNYMESCQINRGTVTVVGNAGFVCKADSGVWWSAFVRRHSDSLFVGVRCIRADSSQSARVYTGPDIWEAAARARLYSSRKRLTRFRRVSSGNQIWISGMASSFSA